MNAAELAECRAIGRAYAPRGEDSRYRRDYMVVKSVRGSVVDVDGGTAKLPMKVTGVPITTACTGVRVGDVVVVDTYMHRPLAVGVLAR